MPEDNIMTLLSARTATVVVIALTICAVVILSAAIWAQPDPEQFFHEQPWSFYLYLPEEYSPERSWPLFIGLVNSADDGLDCWSTWRQNADIHGFVLLCPELADSDGRLYQQRGSERLLSIIDRVYSEYSLTPEIFLTGFSAGGQFIQGFVFENPNNVVGASVMAPENFYQSPSGASHIPFVLFVGQQDERQNIDVARQLAALLEENGNAVELYILPQVGHTISEDAIELTLDLYNQVVGP
jgi:phospholipase/carboxylesterase